MSGITDIKILLDSMSPEMADELFVFVSIASGRIPGDLKADGVFREKEGTTIICEESEALRNSLAYEARWKRITLSVHSSLEAVGFLHAISEALSKAGISCNVISAYYHDHIFVKESAAERALEVLKDLSKGNSNATTS